jgi:ADP-ribose pyrophosphatase
MDRFQTNEGREGDYHYMTNNNAVAVIAQLGDDQFVMLREYRFVFDRVSLSCVMGGIEPGETAEASARREIVEEIGYEAGDMIRLGQHASAPAFSSEVVDIFLARNLREVGKPDDGGLEETEVVVMTAEQIEDAIASGEIWDGQVVTPWHVARRYLAKERGRE